MNRTKEEGILRSRKKKNTTIAPVAPHYPLPPSRRNNLVMEKRLNNVSVRARWGTRGERGRMQFREEDRGDGRGRNTRSPTHTWLSRRYCINSVNCQFVPARRREEKGRGTEGVE